MLRVAFEVNQDVNVVRSDALSRLLDRVVSHIREPIKRLDDAPPRGTAIVLAARITPDLSNCTIEPFSQVSRADFGDDARASHFA
jgi:hypothetical protein